MSDRERGEGRGGTQIINNDSLVCTYHTWSTNIKSEEQKNRTRKSTVLFRVF